MKTTLSLIALSVLMSVPALAHRGYHHSGRRMIDGPRLTCAQAQNLVQTRGEVVMFTGEWTYDRIVAADSFCSRLGDEQAKPFWMSTVDNAECFVGYTCGQDNH